MILILGVCGVLFIIDIIIWIATTIYYFIVSLEVLPCHEGMEVIQCLLQARDKLCPIPGWVGEHIASYGITG